MADVESKGIPHDLPSSLWLKATGQCVLERYLSATMFLNVTLSIKRMFSNKPQLGLPKHYSFDIAMSDLPVLILAAICIETHRKTFFKILLNSSETYYNIFAGSFRIRILLPIC